MTEIGWVAFVEDVWWCENCGTIAVPHEVHINNFDGRREYVQEAIEWKIPKSFDNAEKYQPKEKAILYSQEFS